MIRTDTLIHCNIFGTNIRKNLTRNLCFDYKRIMFTFSALERFNISLVIIRKDPYRKILVFMFLYSQFLRNN